MRTSTVLVWSLFLFAACGKSGNTDRQTESGKRDSGAAGRPVPVMTTAAQKRDLPIYLDGLGSVVAYRTVTVRAQVDGRLDQVFFKEGQPVKKGQLLAQIDPRAFLNGLHQAQGQLARDQASLAKNKKDLNRYEELAQKNLVAPQQVDDQQSLVAQGEGSIVADKAAIESAKLNLEYARIVSPIDGITGMRNIDPGNIIRAGDPTGIVVVTQLDPVAVIFTLPQDALPEIAKYQRQGALEAIVSSRDGNMELGRGKLEVIDNAINATTATLRLKAVLANPAHALWPNQFVKVRLMLTVRRAALVIPAAAVQRGPSGPFVYVANEDQTVQTRAVTIDLLQGDHAIVAQGLEEGTAIVIEGQNQLRPGSKILLRTNAGEAAKSESASGSQRSSERRGSSDEGSKER